MRAAMRRLKKAHPHGHVTYSSMRKGYVEVYHTGTSNPTTTRTRWNIRSNAKSALSRHRLGNERNTAIRQVLFTSFQEGAYYALHNP